MEGGKKMAKAVIVLHGDAIGQEIMNAAIDVLTSVARTFNHTFHFTQYEIGGTSYDKYGEPLTDGTIDACLEADAILLGAIGGNKWDALPLHLRPEQGLLNIRKALSLYSNIRPIIGFAPFVHASSLKE